MIFDNSSATVPSNGDGFSPGGGLEGDGGDGEGEGAGFGGSMAAGLEGGEETVGVDRGGDGGAIGGSFEVFGVADEAAVHRHEVFGHFPELVDAAQGHFLVVRADVADDSIEEFFLVEAAGLDCQTGAFEVEEGGDDGFALLVGGVTQEGLALLQRGWGD